MRCSLIIPRPGFSIPIVWMMGTGTIEIDENRQLQLVTQYYKSQGDDYGPCTWGKMRSAVTGDGKALPPTVRIPTASPAPKRHPISLQYSDADFSVENLSGQVYYPR